MSKIVVIGLPGQTGLWVADTESGVIVPLAPPYSGALASADALRQNGVLVAKGVNLAIAFGSMEEIAHSHHEGG